MEACTLEQKDGLGILRLHAVGNIRQALLEKNAHKKSLSSCSSYRSFFKMF